MDALCTFKVPDTYKNKGAGTKMHKYMVGFILLKKK